MTPKYDLISGRTPRVIIITGLTTHIDLCQVIGLTALTNKVSIITVLIGIDQLINQ